MKLIFGIQHYFRYATLFQPDQMFHTKKKIWPQFFFSPLIFFRFQFFANIFVEDQFFGPQFFFSQPFYILFLSQKKKFGRNIFRPNKKILPKNLFSPQNSFSTQFILAKKSCNKKKIGSKQIFHHHHHQWNSVLLLFKAVESSELSTTDHFHST